MRNIILAFGLLLIPAVTMAAPSNTSHQHCKFRVLKSSRIVFGKACTKDERRLLPHAIKAVKSPYTLKGDLKTAMRSAQGFYTRNCAKVVRERKATSHNWAECYDRLPSSMMQQQMMIPSISLKTFVWEMCGRIRNLNKLASCAVKAATDESGAVNSTIFEAVEAYRTLKAQKRTAHKYIKAVTGGCELAAFGRLQCAGLNPLPALFFIISLLASRRSERKEWWDFEALGHLDARKMVWIIEDELWKARWVERAIEIAITLAAFSFGGLVLGLTSTLLAQKRYGWGSIFALLISVIFWGSALEWLLFLVKAGMCFLANTDEGFQFLRQIGHWRWKRQVAKLK